MVGGGTGFSDSSPLQKFPPLVYFGYFVVPVGFCGSGEGGNCEISWTRAGLGLGLGVWEGGVGGCSLFMEGLFLWNDIYARVMLGRWVDTAT